MPRVTSTKSLNSLSIVFAGWKKGGATHFFLSFYLNPYSIQWTSFQLVVVRTRVIKLTLLEDFEAFIQSLMSLKFVLNKKKGLYMSYQCDEEDTEKKHWPISSGGQSIIYFFSKHSNTSGVTKVNNHTRTFWRKIWAILFRRIDKVSSDLIVTLYIFNALERVKIQISRWNREKYAMSNFDKIIKFVLHSVCWLKKGERHTKKLYFFTWALFNSMNSLLFHINELNRHFLCYFQMVIVDTNAKSFKAVLPSRNTLHRLCRTKRQRDSLNTILHPNCKTWMPTSLIWLWWRYPVATPVMHT